MKVASADGTRSRRALHAGLVILGVAVMLLGNLPMLSSDLGPVDDHETVTWMGRDGGITLARIPAILMTTEVGNFGSTTRFRPVGLGLKILESWAFGDAVPVWFLVRSILLGIAAAGFALGALALLDRSLQTLPAAGGRPIRRGVCVLVPVLILLVLQGQPVWEGIANRLGPSENYAMLLLGIGIGALALADRPQDRPQDRAHRRHAGVILIGIATAFSLLVLTKETLVSLAPLVGVAGLSLHRRVPRVTVFIAAVIAGVGPLLILLAVGPTAGGGDVYGRGFGLGRVYETGLVWIRAPWLAIVLLVALAAAVALDHRGVRAGIGLRWWVLASGAAQVIDMFGHAGEAWLRYRLVLDLGAVFQMTVIITAAAVILIEKFEDRSPEPSARRWAALVVAGAVAFAGVWGGFAVTDRYERAVSRAALAEDFNAAVASAASTVGGEGLVLIVLERPGHSEWGHAATAFLRHRFGGTASAVAFRDGATSVTVATPNVGPMSAPAVTFGVMEAIAAGVPTVCLYFLRATSEPVDLCRGLPEVVHR